MNVSFKLRFALFGTVFDDRLNLLVLNERSLRPNQLSTARGQVKHVATADDATAVAGVGSSHDRSHPAPAHGELKALTVAYHPARLEVQLNVPLDQIIGTGILDEAHRPVHKWEGKPLASGVHRLALDLPALKDGSYFLEMTTSTQRTVRQFRLQQE